MHPAQRQLLTRLVDTSYRSPWKVLAVSLAVGAVATFMSMQLGFRGDFIELLPAKTDEVQDLRAVEKSAGGGGYLIVQLLGGTREQRRAAATAFAPRLEKEQDVVRYVEFHFDIGFFKDRALLALPTDTLKALENDVSARIAWEKKIANPLYVDLGEETPPADFEAIEKKYAGDVPSGEYIESKSGEELYLLVKPSQLAGNLDFNRRLISRVKSVSSEVLAQFPDIKADYTGAYVIRVEEDELMQADLTRAATIATLVSLGIILLASRRPVALIIVAAPVSIGIAATFAFAWVLIGHLNPVTGFLGAILIGLGIEYGVHLSMRYWEERHAHEPLEAMREAVTGTFAGALTSAATNAAAFFVLIFAQFDAFKQFGQIAAFGVISTVLAAYLMGPAVLFIAERIRPARGADQEALPVDDKSEFVFSTPLLFSILAVIGLAAVYSLSVASHVGFETNLRSLKGESPATNLDVHIAEQLGVIMVPALASADDLAEARTIAKVASDVQRELGSDTSIARVASLNDLVPWDPEQRLEVIARIRRHVEDVPKSLREGKQKERVDQILRMTDAKPWTVDDLPPEIRRRFSALDGKGTFVLIFPKFAGYDVAELRVWARDLNEISRRVKAAGATTHILDGNRIAAKIFDLIKSDGPLVMGLAAIVVFAMIWLSLRKFSHACLVAGPLYIGMTCIFGAMHLFDVHLNFFNVVVLPNLLAIAVDNSVHLFHRYKEEGPGSLGHIMRHTGFAALVATISNAAGYGAMLVARHAGLRSVGTLAVLGVACTFVGTTIFFPTVMALLERRPSQQPSKRPS